MIRGIFRCAALTALLILPLGFAWATGEQENSSQATVATVDTESFPLEITDGLGNRITVSQKPQSIISLSLFSDEVLLNLVDPDRFAGASSLATDPIYSNVADVAAEIETRVDFNVEQIISIYPDIVIAASWSEADKITQLRDAGLVVYQVNTPFSVDGIKEEIRSLAAIVGEPDAGEDLVSRMEEKIAELTRVVVDIPESERVQALDYNNWGTASGADTTWNEVLRLAGVDNAAAPYESGDFGQVPMSKELIVEIDPDVIFLPGFIWGDDEGAEGFRAQVLNDPAFADLYAIEHEQVYMVPEHLKGTYSHYLVDAAKFVARLVYPQRF